MPNEQTILGLTVKFEFVTPEMAKYWLDRNEGNRNLSMRRARVFANELAANRYVINHQGIAISEFDRPLDGQHRLMGIMISGKGAWMQVTRGFPNDTPMGFFCDRGAIRHACDVVPISKEESEEARVMCNLAGMQHPTEHELLAATKIFRSYAADLPRSRPKTYGTAGVRAGCILRVMMGKGVNYAVSQYEALILRRTSKFSLGTERLNAWLEEHQAEHGGIANGRKVSVAFYLLDERNKNKTKIKLNPIPTDASEFARSVFSASAMATASAAAE